MYKMLYTYKVTFYSHSKRGEMIFSDAQFPTKGLKKKTETETCSSITMEEIEECND